jgi:hypothetical protein
MNNAEDQGGAAKAAQEPVASLDLGTIQSFLESIRSQDYAEYLNRAERQESLYHYTDLAGLNGIVSDHDLWLTNARFSNDDREMTHGYDVARGVIDELNQTEGLDSKPFLEELRGFLDPTAAEDVYICCFCEEGNLLSQWRGYGADGTGVSVEVEPPKFSWATGGDMQLGLMRFWRVYYEEHEQKDMVRRAIDFARRQPLGANRDSQARKAADVIKFFIPTFKSADFQEEKEWRLIFTPGMQDHLKEEDRIYPNFRVARRMLVPHYSFRKLIDANIKLGGPRGELEKLPIRRVLVGPSARAALNQDSARMLLARRGYPQDVVRSKTSYRGA